MSNESLQNAINGLGLEMTGSGNHLLELAFHRSDVISECSDVTGLSRHDVSNIWPEQLLLLLLLLLFFILVIKDSEAFGKKWHRKV